jgi:hypothetical protein
MKTIFALLAAIGTCSLAGASSVMFPFELDGPHAHDSTTSQGFAYGALTWSGPNTLTLDMNYASLSSPVTQIVGFFGFDAVYWPGQVWSGKIVTFHQGSSPDLPSSGTFTWTYTTTFFDEAFYSSLASGRGYLSVSTQNYPFYSQGEIGGAIPVPEPRGLAFLALAGSLVLVRRRSIICRVERGAAV